MTRRRPTHSDDSPHASLMTDLDEFPKFKQYVWDDPSLCNNCYTRVRQVIPVWKDQYRASLRSALSDSVHFRTEDGVMMYGVDSRDGIEGGVYRSQTSCEECGSVGCRSIRETVSDRVLLQRLDRIIDWLETQDLDPDVSEMRRVVHEHQTNDPVIFAEAVEAGI